MPGETEIVVIGKTDEAAAMRVGKLTQAVGFCEKGVPLLQLGFSGEPEAFRGVIAEAVDF
jgi:hypothetical protein